MREELLFWIWSKSTGAFIGGTGFHIRNWSVPCFEIGYWVRTSFSGQGYITEAVNALIRYAFLELNAKRVEIRCDEDNLRSRKIPKCLGFQLDTVFKQDGFFGGVYDKARNE